jgi:hypothetical protein
MEDSKTSSKKSTRRKVGKKSTKLPIYGMSIDLLMIWSLTPSSPKVASLGLARTTMVMCNPILLPKDTVLSVL